MMHQLRDLADLKDIRMGGVSQTVRVIMLVYSIVRNVTTNHMVLELTDFTSPFQSPVNKFKVEPGSQSEKALELIKRDYGIGIFLKVGKIAMVNVSVEVSNHTLDFKYVLSSVELINKIEDVRVLKGDESVNFSKIKKLIERLKIEGIWNNVKNKDEIENILVKISKAEQSKNEKSFNSSDNSIINPLFVKPTYNDSQIPQYSQVVFPEDTIDTENIIDLSSDSDIEADDTNSNKETQRKTSSTSEELPNFWRETSHLSNEDELSISEDRLSKQRKLSSSPREGLRLTIPRSKKKTSSQELKRSQHNLNNESLIVNNKMDEHASEQTATNTIRPSTDQDLQSSDESTEENYFEDPNGIESVLAEVDHELNSVFNFTGYIVGIEPWNVVPFGRSFNSLPNTTSFRILISNIIPEKGTVFKVNKNCIALDFRSKIKILQFFGHDQVESLLESKMERLNAFNRLTTETHRKKFNIKIEKKKIGLTVGSQFIWESNITIDELLNQI